MKQHENKFEEFIFSEKFTGVIIKLLESDYLFNDLKYIKLFNNFFSGELLSDNEAHLLRRIINENEFNKNIIDSISDDVINILYKELLEISPSSKLYHNKSSKLLVIEFLLGELNMLIHNSNLAKNIEKIKKGLSDTINQNIKIIHEGKEFSLIKVEYNNKNEYYLYNNKTKQIIKNSSVKYDEDILGNSYQSINLPNGDLLIQILNYNMECELFSLDKGISVLKGFMDIKKFEISEDGKSIIININRGRNTHDFITHIINID